MRRWATGPGTRGVLALGLAAAALVGCRGGFDVPGGLTPVDVGATLDTAALGDGVGVEDAGDADSAGDAGEEVWEPPVTCGDGVVDEGEQCDDTAPGDEDVPGDGCFQCAVEPGWTCLGAPSQCETRCGDGVHVEGVEACDDGNTADGDGCSASCKEEDGWGCDGSPSTCEELCGDGHIVGTEDCDPGPDPGAEIAGCEACHAAEGWTCNDAGTACTTECGDGLTAGAEECDDQNTTSGDGCSNACKVEGDDGWECDATVVPTVCWRCGDGLIQWPEECDAGDLGENDPNVTGCTSDCLAAPGWICEPPPEGSGEPIAAAGEVLCYTVCGDGLVAGDEECDVGEDTLPAPYDTACVDCVVGQGWKCDTDAEPSQCTSICGDGTVVPGLEGCDDGGTASGDGCDKDCQPEPGWLCPVTGGGCDWECGDGHLAAGDEGEGCDDGNKVDGDGCDKKCKVEEGWSCVGAPGETSTCGTVCGDGVVTVDYEQCDDLNKVGGDGCSGTCQVETGWTCDGGQPSACVQLCDDQDGDGYGAEVNGQVGPGCLSSTPDCNDANPNIYPGAYELCDNLDNDCDGVTDEDVSRPCSNDSPPFAHDGVGECVHGVQWCVAGQWQAACDGEVLPAAEGCGNLVDDDCDGLTDEGCSCHYLGKDEGVCLLGVSDPGAPTKCGQPQGYEPEETSCDGLDNDCDGAVDEGCPCDYLGSQVGVCAQSVRDPGGTCSKPPSYEANETSCDGLDNDCDGAVDEGCPCTYLNKPHGVCADAKRGSDGVCAAPAHFEETEASCDNRDNDCDGLTDEGTDQPCYDGPAGTVSPGRPCHGGVRACVHGKLGPCTGQVLPATEVCGNGIDDDCNGAVDDEGPGIVVCDGPGSSIDCKIPAAQCVGGGGTVDCAVPSAQPETCGPLNSPNGVDEDCDGVTDEVCNAGCVVVVPEGSVPKLVMTALGLKTTIHAAIQEAANGQLGPRRVCVAVPEECTSGGTKTVTFHETIQMVNGVDVQGGYEATWDPADLQLGVSLTLAPAHCVTEVRATDPSGHVFGPDVTDTTTLSGFTLYPAENVVGVGGDGNGGGGGFPGDPNPATMHAVVTIAGARGAKLARNKIYGGGGAAEASYGVIITDYQVAPTGPSQTAHAELVGNTIEGGDADVLSVGVLVRDAEAVIRACQPGSVTPDGRCSDGWGDKVHISAGGNGEGAQAYGVWLDGATNTLVDQAAIYAHAADEAAAVGVTGPATGVRVMRSALDGFGGSQRNVGLLMQGCDGASPWIADNEWIAGAGAPGEPAAFGVLVEGACAPLIEGNQNIVGCSEGTCAQAFGVRCEADPGGTAGACDVVNNAVVFGSWSVQPPLHAVGIGCRDGACRRVTGNALVQGAGWAQDAVGMELMGALPQTFVDANLVVGGCGSTLSAGLVAHDAAARLQNSVLVGRQCDPTVLSSGTQSYGALVRTSASGHELDLHSNLLTPGDVGGANCSAVGLALGVVDGAPLPMGPTGAFRNNVVQGGGCSGGISTPVAAFSATQPPRILKNNDLVSSTGFVYWDADGPASRTLPWVNAMAPSDWVGENISADPGYDPATWPHLTSDTSPCVDAGTSELAPATDMDGQPRPRSALDPPDIGPDELGVIVQPVGP